MDDGGISIGVLLDYTGNAAANGFNSERGVLLAQRFISSHREGEAPFKMLFRDARGSEETARQATQELIDEGVAAVIGPTGDELLHVVVPMLAEAEVLLFSPVATSTTGVNVAAPWFRMSPGNVDGSSSGRLIGENLAKELIQMNAKRVGIIREGGAYHGDVVNGFVEKFISLGGEVPHQFVVGQVSHSTIARDPALNDASIDGFLLALDIPSASQLVTEVTAQVTKVPQWYLTPRLKSQVFLLNTPSGALEGAMGLSPRISYRNQVCEESLPDDCFVQQFSDVWNDEPLDDTYFMYDAAALLLVAMDRTLRQDGELSMASLTSAIFDISAQGGVQFGWNSFATAIEQNASGGALQYAGLTGPILFSAGGARRGGNTIVWRVENGRIVDE